MFFNVETDINERERIQMNAVGQKKFSVWVALVLLGLFVFGPVAEAQLTMPLQIWASSPITDEAGKKLEGTAGAPGDLVMVLEAQDGNIYPPASDGMPDSRNPLIRHGVTGIGALTLPTDSNPGSFSHTVGDGRPKNDSKVFVRVFNAPTIDEATFYADSELFSVKPFKTMIVNLEKTDQPLYRDDKDGDGLVESWEMSLGTSDENADSDGDSMSDGDEFAAGTDAADKNSLLAISGIAYDDLVSKGGSGVNQVTLAWPSVTGKRYRVQFTADNLADHPQFSDVGSVITATSDFTTIAVDVDEQKESGMYRIRLAE